MPDSIRPTMTEAPLVNAPLASARPQAASSIPVRLTSLDARRGSVMFLMMAEALGLLAAAAMLTLWLILYRMHRRKIFLKL